MKKKLAKDREGAIVAGVVSGMARYFNSDATLFRIVAITFLIITGIFPGLLIYLAAWYVMPNESPTKVDYDIE
jgi:phage shock protein C